MTRHLTREQLLRFLDGEMTKVAEWKAAAHLRACWACQAELSRMREQIAGILDAQRSVFEPSLPPPPAPWPRLESRLERLKQETRLPIWKRILPFFRGSLRLQWVLGSVAMLTALTAIIGLSVWVSVTPASAQEVLRRAAAADGRRLSTTKQQAVRQRVRVRKTARLMSTMQTSSLETWGATGSTFWRLADDPINADLHGRYAANGLSLALPLSPASVETWVRLAGSEPKVSRDGEVITVEAPGGAPGQTGTLEKVSLRIQSEAWHCDEITLSFRDATFQITEVESSVLARSEVPAEVMAELEPAKEDSRPAVAKHSDPEPAGAVNLDDLEMAVRYDLHSLGADLGEGVEVSVRPPDVLVVDARQASQEIKQRLTAAFGSRPGVRLELQSAGPGDAPARGVTRKIPDVTTPSTADDQRLFLYFGSAAAQENFTRSVLEASGRILTRFYAVRELAGRWTPEKESGLSAVSKSRLGGILRDHSREIILAGSDLNQMLSPLLKSFNIPAPGNEQQSVGSGEWQNACVSGLEAAQRVDRLLRSMLTVSDSPVTPESALPQLQAGLRDMESAAHLLPRKQ